MALSIGVRVGSKLKVGDHCVKVLAVVQPNLIVLSVDNGPDIVVSDQSSTEIVPEVLVSTGVGEGGNGSRLAFTAPRRIVIGRWEYVEGDKHVESAVDRESEMGDSE